MSATGLSKGRQRRQATNARGLVGTAAVTVAAFAVAACGTGDADAGGGNELVINSYGGAWGDAIERGFIEDFEKETGIEVTLLASADPAKSKVSLLGGQEPPEDIIDLDYATASSLDGEGLTAPIDYSGWKQVTLDAVDEVFRQEWGVGWGSFALGLCYDKRVFPDSGSQPTTWEDFWDTTTFPGPRGMNSWVNDPVPEFALLADSVAIEDLYPIDAERALEKLDELEESIPKFTTDAATLQQMLIGGEVVMEACFTHRVQELVDEGAPIGISYDQARIQTDYFVVWEDAPNRENAMKFLAYIMEREQQAKWATIGYTSPVNRRAFDEIPKDVAARIANAPGHDTFVMDEQWYAETEDGVSNRQLVIESFESDFGS